MIGFVILVFLKLNNYSNSEILITGILVTGSFKILPSLNRVISSAQTLDLGKSVDLEKELLDLKKQKLAIAINLKNYRKIY